MNFVESGCYADGQFVPIKGRHYWSDPNLCSECFENAQRLDEVPEDFALCRTYSGQATTVHRQASDVDGQLSHGENYGSGYQEAHTALSEMDPEEFEDRVLGSGRGSP